jgi:hypothetical protein
METNHTQKLPKIVKIGLHLPKAVMILDGKVNFSLCQKLVTFKSVGMVRFLPPIEAVTQCLETVIPDEPTPGGRDPESRRHNEYEYILDPGSRLAWRDLAGMTDCDTASFARGGSK